MKKTVLGMCAAGALSIGLAGGYGVAEYKHEQADEKRLQAQLERVGMQMAQQLNVQKAMLNEQRKTAQRTTMAPQETISERFMITSNEDGFVRGEKIDGNGEGIYYNVAFFKDYDLEDVKPGNVVDVEWNKQSYETEDWDDIQRIVKIK